MMSMCWALGARKRPDPYLDWEVRNRPPGGPEERWCCVLLQIEPGPAHVPEANLKRLQTAATKGKTDLATGAFIRVVMHGDEQRRLKDAIDHLETDPTRAPDADDVRWEFFVYVHEGDIYEEDGQFAHRTGFFKIVWAGPPIPLSLSGKAIELAPTKLPALAGSPADHRPVAIGIIDDGLAFGHERFCGRGEDGKPQTRIAALWLQDIETIDGDFQMVFGQTLDSDEINKHLVDASHSDGIIDDAEVYRLAHRWDFSRDKRERTEFRLAHGTHVMDLACGFDPEDETQQRKARQFPILAVQLPDAITADTSGISMGSYVLQALRQIMLWADNFRESHEPDAPVVALPLVVNFSYGLMAGPKDGSHYLEEQIRRLVKHRQARIPTAVVLPSGNNYRDRTAAKMKLECDVSQLLDWIILPDDSTPSYVEIWFDVDASDAESPLAIVLTPPLGPPSPETRPVADKVQLLQIENPVCAIYYDCVSATNRARIFLAVNPSKSWDDGVPVAPSGRWGITLTNKTTHPITVHIYIQRDDTPAGFRRKGRQSHFDHQEAYERDPVTGNYDALSEKGAITHEGTISAIGTGDATVLVGAAQDRECLQPTVYASSGPTPGKFGPDVSAIAEDGLAFPGLLAAGSMSGSIMAMGGTSVGAPQVTRELARNGVRPEMLKGRYVGELGEQSPADTNERCAAAGAMDAKRLGKLVLHQREPATGQIRKWRQRED